MLHVAVEDRACLVGIIAYGDEVIPVLVHILIYLTRLVVADVDTHLAHYEYGLRIDTWLCLYTARIYGEVFSVGLKKSMRHLTAACVACAEHEHLDTVLLSVHRYCAHEEGDKYHNGFQHCFHCCLGFYYLLILIITNLLRATCRIASGCMP